MHSFSLTVHMLFEPKIRVVHIHATSWPASGALVLVRVCRVAAASMFPLKSNGMRSRSAFLSSVKVQIWIAVMSAGRIKGGSPSKRVDARGIIMPLLEARPLPVVPCVSVER